MRYGYPAKVHQLDCSGCSGRVLIHSTFMQRPISLKLLSDCLFMFLFLAKQNLKNMTHNIKLLIQRKLHFNWGIKTLKP